MRNSRSSGWRGRRSGLLGLAVLVALCPFLAAQDFRRGVQPFLEKYCYDCHGDDKTKADLNLELFKDAAGFYRDQRLWRQVITQVVAGEMPPPERKTRPTQAEIEALQGQVRGLLKEAVYAWQRQQGISPPDDADAEAEAAGGAGRNGGGVGQADGDLLGGGVGGRRYSRILRRNHN